MRIIKSKSAVDDIWVFVFFEDKFIGIIYDSFMAESPHIMFNFVKDKLAKIGVSASNAQIYRIVRQYIIAPLTLTKF